MDVCMRDFQSEHTYADSLAWYCCLDCKGNFLGESAKSEIGLVIKMEDIIIFYILGDDKGMTLYKRIDVQKSVELVILGYLVRGISPFAIFVKIVGIRLQSYIQNLKFNYS